MYQILIRVRAQLCQVADERRHPQEELPIAGMRRQEQYCLSGNQHDAQVIARCQEPDQATDTARFPRDIHLVVRLGSELPQLISRPPSIPNTDAANDHQGSHLQRNRLRAQRRGAHALLLRRVRRRGDHDGALEQPTRTRDSARLCARTRLAPAPSVPAGANVNENQQLRALAVQSRWHSHGDHHNRNNKQPVWTGRGRPRPVPRYARPRGAQPAPQSTDEVGGACCFGWQRPGSHSVTAIGSASCRRSTG